MGVDKATIFMTFLSNVVIHIMIFVLGLVLTLTMILECYVMFVSGSNPHS